MFRVTFWRVRVEGPGLRVDLVRDQSSRDSNQGLRVYGLGLIEGLGSRIQGLGFKVKGLGSRV